MRNFSWHSDFLPEICWKIFLSFCWRFLISGLNRDSSDSNHSSKFTEKRHISKKVKAAGRTNTQAFSEYFSVRTRIILILCFVYVLSFIESKSITSYVLLSMSMMSTSNVQYEWRFHYIKISMNVYKYQKLWVWFDSMLIFLSNHCWSLICTFINLLIQ